MDRVRVDCWLVGCARTSSQAHQDHREFVKSNVNETWTFSAFSNCKDTQKTPSLGLRPPQRAPLHSSQFLSFFSSPLSSVLGLRPVARRVSVALIRSSFPLYSAMTATTSFNLSRASRTSADISSLTPSLFNCSINSYTVSLSSSFDNPIILNSRYLRTKPSQNLHKL